MYKGCKRAKHAQNMSDKQTDNGRLFRRRHTHAVRIGNTSVGADNPVRLQSMTNTPTLDTDASVAQCISIANAGADIVRLTAQGVMHAKNLGEIHSRLRAAGCDIPLVADIHFNPAAAFEAARHVEKVRINPGNFVDPGRTFVHLEYTDAEYADELHRLEDKLVPLLDLCRKRGTALRIGVNHGSLSDRIMSRYGDTPAGMVESAMEFMRICRAHNFDQVVISIKASNVCVMVETVRLLADVMQTENMTFPLHLGVTEAGDGEDGRVKSAVGIGMLLAEGIGDTIRVSLSEDPTCEVPVARMLTDYIDAMTVNMPRVTRRRERVTVPQVVGVDLSPAQAEDIADTLIEVCGPDAGATAKQMLADMDAEMATAGKSFVKVSYPADMPPERVVIAAAVDLGSLLVDGWADGIWIDAPSMSTDAVSNLAMTIMQAARRRISKTEYIACPGCGRTLFDLQDILARVRRATGHLKGLKIGVMGCIVNGPGEMADADYGYVGAAKGHVSLYRRKDLVAKNIPETEAIPALIDLIKANGDWHDPE